MAEESQAVLRLHSGNGPHEEMDRRALEAFVLALDDAGVPDTELPNGVRLRQVLFYYFGWVIRHMGLIPPLGRRRPRRAPAAALVVGRSPTSCRLTSDHARRTGAEFCVMFAP